jgi:hypothetical protein
MDNGLPQILIPIVAVVIVAGLCFAFFRRGGGRAAAEVSRDEPAAAPPPSAKATTQIKQESVRETLRGIPPSENPAKSASGKMRYDSSARNDIDSPTLPMFIARPKKAAQKLTAVGINIVLKLPVEVNDFAKLPVKLEVMYGNNSPKDPSEILLYWPANETGTPKYTFSKNPGETVGHIQLNHYTISPDVQAEMAIKAGKVTLRSRVKSEDTEKYQIAVNKVPLGPEQTTDLNAGDIISMGIYRLKLTT